MLCKSCMFSHTEHNTIGFAIFGFLYDFIWNLQVLFKAHKGVKNLISLRPLETFHFHNSTLSSNNQAPTRTLPSHIHPQRWGWARCRRGRARAGKQATLDYDLAHHGPTCRGSLDRDVTGERRRQSNGGAAAKARIPVRIGVGLNNVRHG
jgi:hypothetical protein